jgi:2-polyprenyl-3-methyl-5-hydroxy-6-metoxy-1,4-benzoquinol methylase
MRGDAGTAHILSPGLPTLEAADGCPVCGARHGTIISTRDRRGHPLTNLLCGTCGLIRVTPRPSREEHEEFYRSNYRLEYKRRRLPSPRQQLRAARAARERLPWFLAAAVEGTDVLEIGCGYGHFLRLVADRGHKTLGLEPDPACAQFARQAFGLEVETGFAERLAIAGRRFGCICAFHVIEHVLDPVEFLLRLHDFAAPDARLLLETPDVEAPFPRPARRFHRAHLYSFSARTLRFCLQAAGWNAIKEGSSSDGGNRFVIAVPGPSRSFKIPPGEAEEALARWRKSASARRYYLSPVVWLRALRRLGSHAAEFLLAQAGALLGSKNIARMTPPLVAGFLEGLLS